MAREDRIYPLGPEGQPMRSGGSKPVDNSSKGKSNDVKPGLLQKWFGSFTDDKGAFQGGQHNRFLGRIRDDLDEKFGSTKPFKQRITQLGDTEGTGDYPGVSSEKGGQAGTIKESHPVRAEISEDLREADKLTDKAGYDMYVKNLETNPDFNRRIHQDLKDQTYEVPAYSEEFTLARGYALDFDVTDKAQVTEMQKRLNAAGITDADGKALEIDGILGQKTTDAIKNLQSQMTYENQYAKQLLTKRQDAKRAMSNAKKSLAIIKSNEEDYERKIHAINRAGLDKDPVTEVRDMIEQDSRKSIPVPQDQRANYGQDEDIMGPDELFEDDPEAGVYS